MQRINKITMIIIFVLMISIISVGCQMSKSDTMSETQEAINKEKRVVAEYSLLSSLSPALAINPKDLGDFEICEVTAEDGGELLKYSIDEKNDKWIPKESGDSLLYESDEIIYWKQTDNDKNSFKLHVKGNDSNTELTLDIEFDEQALKYVASIN